MHCWVKRAVQLIFKKIAIGKIGCFQVEIGSAVDLVVDIEIHFQTVKITVGPGRFLRVEKAPGER